MSDHINIVRLKAVSNALDALKEKVVFVGGATISLYTDRPVLTVVRPTDDVDVIIEILNYNERGKLEEKLRAIGFKNDIASGIICRFIIQGISVDVMPTDDPTIGFKNQWYPLGFKNAIDHSLDKNITIKILSAPYFIATKMEAFKSRGQNKGLTSHDFEDIVYVLENRTVIWEEFENCDNNVNSYLKTEFSKLLENKNLSEWIDSHVERASPPATYSIIENIKQFCQR